MQKARAAGIPVVAYDRLIADPYAFYLSFDNVEVGRQQARAVYQVRPRGNYVFILGSPTDPNADLLHQDNLRSFKQPLTVGTSKWWVSSTPRVGGRRLPSATWNKSWQLTVTRWTLW